MPFDPAAYEKAKKSIKPAATGFDPVLYASIKKAQLASTELNPPPGNGANGPQEAAPPLAPTRPGRVGRVLDFTRRAFMGDSVEPSLRNPVQNALHDATDMLTGVSHLIGQGLVEGGKLVRDTAVSGAAPLKQILGIGSAPDMNAALHESPLARRATAMPGQVGEAISPEGRKMAKEMFLDPVVDSFKRSFGYNEGKAFVKDPTFKNLKTFVSAPIKAVKEHPLFTLMDWSVAGSAAGQGIKTGLRLTGKTAKAAGNMRVAGMVEDALSVQREALPVAPRTSIPRTFSDNPITKFAIQKPFDKLASNPALQEFMSSNSVLKWLAPEAMLTPEARAGIEAGKTASRAQNEFYRLRNERMDTAMKKFQQLPDNERESFVAVIQGRAMPRQMSPKFKDTYDWYKQVVADEQAKFQLPDEVVKRVAFQPLATAQGLLTPDDYALALRGDKAAVAKVNRVTNELQESRVRVQEQALREWMGIKSHYSGGVAGRPYSGFLTEDLKAAKHYMKTHSADIMGGGRLKPVMREFKADFNNVLDLSDLGSINDTATIVNRLKQAGISTPKMRSMVERRTIDKNLLAQQLAEGVEGATGESIKQIQRMINLPAGKFGIYRLLDESNLADLAKAAGYDAIKFIDNKEFGVVKLGKESAQAQHSAVYDINRSAKEITKLARELAEETAPDPIYFPSVFADKLKLADFMPTKFLQRFKPSFMKGRKGAWGFIEKEPDVAFAIHQSQVERYLQNETMIQAIKEKYALPLKSEKDLKPGYKAFAPDGYIGFYKGSMPLQEAFLRGVGLGQDVDDAFTAAVRKVLPDMVQDKPFIGVRKPTIYQIPADVASKVQEMINPQSAVPEAFKLVYDKPVQAFKFSVLAMSPRWIVNNTIGNVVTSMVGRVSPESFIKAGKKIYRDIIPPEVTAGGFRRAEFPALKKVITPQTGWADKATGFFTGKLPTEGVLKDVQGVVSAPVKAVGQFADTVFEANAMVEDAFRQAAFIDKTTKAAVTEIAKKTSGGVMDMKQSLDRFLERGSFADSNVAKVAGEMLKDEAFKTQMVGHVNRILNDYNSLTKFERGVVRRVIPFWSWWKFVNVLFWTMPVKDPAMAQAIKQLGSAGQEISKAEWKQNGLDVDEVPEWIRGNVILGKTPDGKMLELLNTRSINPLSAAREKPGLGPHFQIESERRTGRNFLTNAPFTHPDEVEQNGAFWRMENGKPVRLDHPTPPPLIAHILRQLPQVNILEALAFPYKTYTGEGLFNGTPRTQRGKEVPLKPSAKIANILGMPISEVDYRRLRQGRVDANKAKGKILKQKTRSERRLERIKLGDGEYDE